MEFSKDPKCGQVVKPTDFIGVSINSLSPPRCIVDPKDPGSCLQLQNFVQNVLLELRTQINPT